MIMVLMKNSMKERGEQLILKRVVDWEAKMSRRHSCRCKTNIEALDVQKAAALAKDSCARSKAKMTRKLTLSTQTNKLQIKTAV